MKIVLSLVCGLCLVHANAFAQRAPSRLEAHADSALALRAGWSPVRLAKWSTLFAATGAAVYGFTQNRTADREYEDIERLCEETPTQCATKPGSSEYADPALESRYQRVVQRDDRAKLALLAGQVGLAASVLLFIMDLPEGSTPDDIPYDPRPLRFGVRADQLQLSLHLAVR